MEQWWSTGRRLTHLAGCLCSFVQIMHFQGAATLGESNRRAAVDGFTDIIYVDVFLGLLGDKDMVNGHVVSLTEI